MYCRLNYKNYLGIITPKTNKVRSYDPGHIFGKFFVYLFETKSIF